MKLICWLRLHSFVRVNKVHGMPNDFGHFRRCVHCGLEQKANGLHWVTILKAEDDNTENQRSL